VEQVAKAVLRVEWASPRNAEIIELQYNPTELSWDKSAQIAEISIPGLDAPLQQFVRGQAEKLSLELFFDTTDQGMGKGAVSVTTMTDRIYQLIKIEPTRHAPPVCTFIWNDQFPGSSLEGNAATGNQRRNGFRCIVESVKQKFTVFSPEGIPLRAVLTVGLREYKTLDEQLAQLNLTSPDRTHSHVTQNGETLSRIAAQYYRNAGDWRLIADANGIEDPRRLLPGVFLQIPPTQ
jgi:nucleoid-associated protein YgaU